MRRVWDTRVNEFGQLKHFAPLDCFAGKAVWVTVEELRPDERSPGRLMWELSGAASELWDRGSDEMRAQWEEAAIAVAAAVAKNSVDSE